MLYQFTLYDDTDMILGTEILTLFIFKVDLTNLLDTVSY